MALEKLNIANQDEVLDLVRELERSGEECAKRFKLVAERNEMFVHGDQFSDINPTSFAIEDAWKPHLPRVTQNHLRNLVNTWKARLTKDRPSVTAWPTSTTPEARSSAIVAAKLIEYLEKEMQLDLIMDDVVRLGCMHGVAGFKITYNPTIDQVEWQRVSLFDFMVDPTKESYDDAQWCIFRAWIDKYEAKEELLASGIEDEPPTGVFRINDSEDREGVEVLEIWHKPTARIPEGLFCKVIGNHVLDARPYPYIFSNLENPTSGKQEAILPLVYFKVDYRRGYPYADTWLSDAIPEQRQINETEATLLRIRRETGNVKLVVPNNAIVQQINTNSQVIVSPDGNAGVGFLAPPVINNLLFADREYHFKRLYDIAGLNEQLVGVDSVKSGTSAKQIAYLTELDGMKHKGTAQSIETMLVRAWKLSLQLVQYYYINERVMRIAAESGFDTMAFRGADIQGITVDLSPRAGLERMPAAKAAQAEADAAAGLIPPQEGMERRTTGQSMSMVEAMTRRIIQMEVNQIMQGAQPEMDSSVEPAIAADEILRIRDLLLNQGSPKELVVLLTSYAEAYQQKAAALASQAAPPGV
jgi:hypothetical protein